MLTSIKPLFHNASVKRKLDNLTLITTSYFCNKDCPFCIAKNNKLFSKANDNFEKVDNKLETLEKNDFIFKKFVLSGNGEPSLYKYDDIATIAFAITNHLGMFDGVRVQTSGNLFYEDKKLGLLENEINDKLEIMVNKVSLDTPTDMKILGYQNDYTQTDNFKNAKNLMFDIALTKHLDVDKFIASVEHLVEANPNILTMRFKALMTGNNDNSSQARWVRENTMSKDEIMRFIEMLAKRYKEQNNGFIVGNTKLLFEKSGSYNKDIVMSGGEVMDYNLKVLNIDDIIQISKQDCKDDSLLK